jgi:hypothetical protein
VVFHEAALPETITFEEMMAILGVQPMRPRTPSDDDSSDDISDDSSEETDDSEDSEMADVFTVYNVNTYMSAEGGTYLLFETFGGGSILFSFGGFAASTYEGAVSVFPFGVDLDGQMHFDPDISGSRRVFWVPRSSDSDQSIHLVPHSMGFAIDPRAVAIDAEFLAFMLRKLGVDQVDVAEVVYNEPRESKCYICMEDFANLGSLFNLTCGHPLCGTCLYFSMMDSVETKCGICRSTYLKHTLHMNVQDAEYVDDEVLGWWLNDVTEPTIGEMSWKQFHDHMVDKYGEWSMSTKPVKIDHMCPKIINVHIRTPRSGTLICKCTHDVSTLYLKLFVSHRLGIRVKGQRLSYMGRTLEDRVLSDYNILDGSEVVLTKKMAGGMAKKVHKTILKTKVTERTVAADRPKYESSYNYAVDAHQRAEYTYNDLLASFDLAAAREFKDWLTHDKTTKDKKVAMFADRTAHVKVMLEIQGKLSIGVERIRQLLVDDVDSNWSDDNGNVDMARLKEAVVARIAVLENAEMRD